MNALVRRHPGILLGATLTLILLSALGVVMANTRSGHNREVSSATRKLFRVAERLRANPQDPIALPHGVSTYYAPAGAGASALRGWIYIPLTDGRCVSAEVRVAATWFTRRPAAGTFVVTRPTVSAGCPGDGISSR